MMELIEALLRSVEVIDGGGLLNSNDGDPGLMLILAGLGLFASYGFFKIGKDRYERAQVVKNTVTERIRSMAVGRTELNGKARPYEQVYQEPFFDGTCVLARWSVHEWKEQNPDDSDDDSKGWVRTYSGYLGDRFVLEDDTGAVTVDRPPMHEYDTQKKTQGRLDNLFEGSFLSRWYEFGPDDRTTAFLEEQDIPIHSSYRRQYRQRVLPADVDLYVLGQATQRDDEDDPTVDELTERYDTFREDIIIQRDESSGEFIVTKRSEDEIVRGNKIRAVLWLTAGVIVFGVTGYIIAIYLLAVGIL